MRFLPFENIIYRTSLSQEEVMRRLGEHTEPRRTRIKRGKWHKFGQRVHLAYEGSISGNTFNISRIIDYKNQLLPFVEGTVKKGPNETLIHLRIKMARSIQIVTALWLGFVGFFLLLTIYESSKQEIEIMNMIISFIMLIGGYGTVIGSFNYESAKAKKDLERWFEVK